jgi:hypothetical protein
LKKNSGRSVAVVADIIFHNSKPDKLWVDKREEFYNKDVKS